MIGQPANTTGSTPLASVSFLAAVCACKADDLVEATA
jgi:hypothetical protein